MIMNCTYYFTTAISKNKNFLDVRAKNIYMNEHSYNPYRRPAELPMC